MKTIGIVNQKGGVGKTTTTIELAYGLYENGYKVLVIDLDQQGNLSLYLDADMTKPTIYDVFLSNCTIREAIQSYNGIDLIPSSKQLSLADKSFSDDDVFLLKDIIEAFDEDSTDKYDFVLLDNGPSRSTLLTMTYVAADSIVIPTESDDGSMAGIDSIYEDLVKHRKGSRMYITDAKIDMILLNKYENTVSHQIARESLDEMSEKYEEHPIVATVRKSIAATDAKTLRQPIQMYRPDSNTADDYKNAVRKLLGRVC